MKKILYYLRENLEITTREAKSTLAFISTAIVATGIYITVNFLTRSEYARYTVEKYAAEVPPVKKEKPSFKKFRFDPNTATASQLTSLGIPLRTTNTILNYRAKGGKFRYRQDLRKIYSLKPEVYAELESWIDLPEKSGAGENLPKKQEEKRVKEKTDSVKEKTKGRSPELPFDINTADTTALKKLKGIGSVFAARIIRFRDALGGFHSLEQLEETYGISPEALTALQKGVVIGSSVKPVFINETDTFRHPYLRSQQVKAILAYRKQHGSFSSVDDLHKIKLLDEETIEKIKPYLSF